MLQKQLEMLSSTTVRTLGGYSLKVHSQNATVYSKMRSNNWDFVTIQAQSQEPSFSPNQVANDVFPYAQIIIDSIESNSTCTEPIFFMTWGRENGDNQNCASWPPVCTYEGMDDSLASRYTYMANVNEGMISPVGRVWRYIRTNNPAIELYDTDGSHPSAAGSYIAMCAFYTTIFHKDPTAITFDYTVKAADAQIIRAAAKLIVFDSLSNWNVGNLILNPISPSHKLKIQLRQQTLLLIPATTLGHLAMGIVLTSKIQLMYTIPLANSI